MGTWAERAIDAEAQLKLARRRVEELEARLMGLLQGEEEAEPRRERAEALLLELSEWIKANPSVRELLPSGFDARLSAQLLLLKYGTRPLPDTYVSTKVKPGRLFGASTPKTVAGPPLRVEVP